MTGFGRISRELLEERGVKFCEANQISSMAELRQIPWPKLRELFMEYLKEAGMFASFNICTDGYVLPLSLEDSILTGAHHDIDYIIGCTIDEVHQSMGRVNMAAAQRGWGRCQNMQGKKPAYFYCFDRLLPGEQENAFVGKAFHSADLWYIFGTLNRCWRPFTEEDYHLSDMMMDYWTNFAKTGNPNGGDLPTWETFNEPDRLALRFSIEKVEMADYSLDGKMTEMEDELMKM